MSHKSIVAIFLVVSAVLFLVSIMFLLPCYPEQNYVCKGRFAENVGQPLGMGSIALALIFFILLFLPRQYFRAWLKYVAWSIPAAALWIGFTPVTCGAPLGICFDKELVTWWSSGIYVALSLAVIFITYLRSRSAPPNS